ncbi:MAG: LytTR family transcriptional regulator DNA-binding domain-containing protein, partial [Bacteroidales bacterium]|nr:LytTR family transcriptional regulator DNA-binding domain-containing protein [Bacteroidales bacterium]
RANRQFIISRAAVKDISIWFGNKLSINLLVSVPEKIIVSKARVGEFKSWFAE